MNRSLLFLLGLAVLGAVGAHRYKHQKKSNKYLHPMSDELIDHINSMKTTWKVVAD